MIRAFRSAQLIVVLAIGSVAGAAPGDRLTGYLRPIAPADLNAGAEAFGPLRSDIPVAPLLKGTERVGWAFLTSDFVSTTGYSGKPIHIVVAIDKDAVITGVRLVEHAEPIVLIGIPESKIRAVTERYVGLDLKVEAETQRAGHDLEIVSGATVTIIVIDDSIVRASLKVARVLGLGDLAPKPAATGPVYEIDDTIKDIRTWPQLSAEGAVA